MVKMRLTVFGGLALGAMATFQGYDSSGQGKPKSPNIIFILTDDHRAGALGYAGNTIIQTPQMDRIAREGVYFANAFVTTPICAASRASILTGLYERTHGYTFQQGFLQKTYMDISYPAVLRQNGYYTGFYGKLGVEYGDPESLFNRAEIYDRETRYNDRRGYFYKMIGEDTVHLTRFTGHKALDFIRNAPSDKPFCLSLSFSAPHAHDNAPDQYFWQEKSNTRYAQETIPPPEMADDQFFFALPREVRDGFNRTRWKWRFDTPEKYQRSVKGYYRMISEIDDEIGEIRKELENKGLAKNTVLIFMGDNGYFLGERQLADKWLMYDLSLRVPMVIFDPRAKVHSDVTDMVLNIDIAGTILDLAGVGAPKPYQGVSLVPYLRGSKPDVPREAILFEHLWDFPQIPSSEGIRTNEWKYLRYRFIAAPEELYNLRSDPAERVNLAGNPDYTTVLARLRKECDARIEKYKSAKLCPDNMKPAGK
jgi:arylsulfatase A-like enzyme